MPESEDRTKRRLRSRQRRQQRSGALKMILAVGVVAVAVFSGWSLFSIQPVEKAKDATVVEVESSESEPKEEKTIISQRTFTVLGVGEGEDGKNLTGAAQVVFDPAQNGIGGLYFDPNTFVVIPGRGLQSISEGYPEGPKQLTAAIAELIGIKSEGYLIISDTEFAHLKESKDVAGLFAEYSDGNVARSEAKELAEQMGAIPKDRRRLYDLPVRRLEIGESQYYEPVKDEMERLVKAIWGRAPQKNDKGVRVIILNGNGTPGVGRTAADRLVDKGYRIIDVKNADHFNYDKTRIMVYNRKAKNVGAALVKDLQSGTVVEESMAQDVMDAVILLGKDFQ